MTLLADIVRNLRRHPLAFVLVLAAWTCAFVRVFLDPTPRTPLLFNVTPSLPYTVAWLQSRPTAFARGDFIVFAFDGEARQRYPGLARQPFFKIVRGVAGDRITVHDRHVFINGTDVGVAKAHTFDGWQLDAVDETVIPPGHYYVQGTSPDSFDSRYRASGLVRADHILGRVRPLF